MLELHGLIPMDVSILATSPMDIDSMDDRNMIFYKWFNPIEDLTKLGNFIIGVKNNTNEQLLITLPNIDYFILCPGDMKILPQEEWISTRHNLEVYQNVQFAIV